MYLALQEVCYERIYFRLGTLLPLYNKQRIFLPELLIKERWMMQSWLLIRPYEDLTSVRLEPVERLMYFDKALLSLSKGSARTVQTSTGRINNTSQWWIGDFVYPTRPSDEPRKTDIHQASHRSCYSHIEDKPIAAFAQEFYFAWT